MSLFAAMLAVSGVAAHATESARIIMWDDLVPAAEPLHDPFKGLNENVLWDFGTIMRAEADLRMGFITEESPEYQVSIKLKRELAERGFDFETLQQAAKDVDAEIDRRNHQVVKDLDGEVVRLPGYALPLEATNDGVKEFLLVPYVGACIHSPPPPPNQTVFVKLDKPFAIQSLYEPVWITGRIEIQQSSRSLSFVDGQADVATGYTLNGITIEPYE